MLWQLHLLPPAPLAPTCNVQLVARTLNGGCSGGDAGLMWHSTSWELMLEKDAFCGLQTVFMRCSTVCGTTASVSGDLSGHPCHWCTRCM
jgi:hypothetical protein